MYKNLSTYLWAPTGWKGLFSRGLIEDFLREIQDEPPLLLEERLIYDITCNRVVFDALWFDISALIMLSQETQLLPREILGINSLWIVLTHDPCMRKLAWHIEERLDKKQKQHARETIIKCAKIRHAITHILDGCDTTGEVTKNYNERILGPAIHVRVCSALEIPID